MSQARTDEEIWDWVELGQHFMLLEINLRSLLVTIEKDKKLRDYAAITNNVVNAVIQVANFNVRIKDLKKDFHLAKNVWCSLAAEYLWSRYCCSLVLREPEYEKEKEFLFRISEAERLFYSETAKDVEPAASDGSWYSPFESFWLLDVNIEILLDKVEFGDHYEAVLSSICGLNKIVGNYLMEVRAIEKSEEELESEREAWRYTVARHLSDCITVADLASRKL